MIAGVIGAGTIGTSLAHALAESDIDVMLIDNDVKALDRAMGRIRQSAQLHRLRSRTSRRSINDVLSRVSLSRDISDLRSCQLVVENIVEDIEAKIALYETLGDVIAEHAVVAANTSAIAISLLSKSFASPERLIGVHFMNPVSEVKTTEVICTEQTSEHAIETIGRLLDQLGNQAVVVRDRPGFVSNRISHLFMNEAAIAVEQGIGSPEEVDSIFTGCFAHAMGPLRTADLIGIDTVVRTLDVMREQTNDDRFTASPLLRSMMEAGNCGRKSGRGFFDYRPEIGVGNDGS